MDPEKQALTNPILRQSHPGPIEFHKRTNSFKLAGLVALLLLARITFTLLDLDIVQSITRKTNPTTSPVVGCTQYQPRVPTINDKLDANKQIIFSEDYRLKSVGYHSGLVQVRSESFDDSGPVGQDHRWDVFYNVEEYLQKTFPLVHETMNLTKVNTHGLIFTWKGTEESLKPAMLMAHLDTVPVPHATLDYWTHPPWSGHYDGKYVYGRGSVDCKNTASGILEAITLLISGGFTPRRTIIVAFGFDEESKGLEGAGHIAPYLEEVYGQDGIAFVVDEGGLGIGEMYGTGFALPATGEKGYVDVNFTLHTPGGHSSIPPPHTSIGILSEIVHSFESAPYHPSLSADSPIFTFLQCASAYGDLPSAWNKNIKNGARKGKKGARAREILADKFAELGRAQRYLVSTSQAADVVGGGVKVNALPETAFVVINHRIAVDSNSQQVMDHVTERVLPLVKKHGLDLDAFGNKFSFRDQAVLDQAEVGVFGQLLSADVPGGELKIVAVNALEPAPVSPTNSSQWELLSSTIQHCYGPQFPDGLVVSPAVMTGNTDTRYSWNLTRHIYRFTPMDRSASFGIHTVDEHLLFDDHISGVYFFHELLRNSDAADF
ncbi:carboxypeptidase S [Meredithblackwellia eburnea MCA 4105]